MEHEFIPLTKQRKEEIKLIIAETLKEIKLGEAIPSADYPDFESWKENLIELDCGLKFAPEDFYVGNKRFFTWDEAKEYEEEVLKPNGFRLPTLVDWTAAFCDCGQQENGEENPNKMEATLNLKKNGYIHPEDMAKYNSNPEDVSEYNQGASGYFWSSTAYSETSAYHLNYNSTGINPQDSNGKGGGFSVRCVLR